MSLVYIIHHDENVLDHDRKSREVERMRPMRYVSKYKSAVRKQIHQPYMIEGPDGSKLLTDSGKHEHRSMGCAQTPLNPPDQFLRKKQGVKWRRLHDHKCPPGTGMPAVPRRSQIALQQPCKGKKDAEEPKSETPKQMPCKGKRKNFVALNIKRVKQSETRRPPPHFVDTPTGQRHNLINSGLVPQHVCGKNFAKVPCYLREHKKMLQKYREKCATDQTSLQKCNAFMSKHGVRKMTMEERLAILEGLRANFTEQMKIFNTLSLYTDTLPKQLRKARIEKDLLQMEQDISFIENNPIIFISDF